MEEYHIRTEQLREMAPKLRAGDNVYLTGTIFTARDAAHKRINELLDEGGELPFPLRDSVVYYAGPTPTREGMAIGSCGPTTSSRMDPYSPRLLGLGQVAMIGKGQRNQAVVDAMRQNGAVYFCAIGGAGALCAQAVKSCRVVAFPELGCESVKQLEVEEFPVIVAIDSVGGNLYQR
ncbi:MAG: FumA C-terminus/TtdB family hydratase beta subunit [Eubacteriales bacterium]|jgi:fumarate hydratase subunit beta